MIICFFILLQSDKFIGSRFMKLYIYNIYMVLIIRSNSLSNYFRYICRLYSGGCDYRLHAKRPDVFQRCALYYLKKQRPQ